MNDLVADARRAAQGTWDGTAVTRVVPSGLPPAIAGSPLWLLATVAFLMSGARTGGVRYLAAILGLTLVFSSAYAWLRLRRRRQEIVVGDGVLVLRTWDGRPRVLRADSVDRVVLTRVRWGRPGAPLLVVAGHSETALARVWGVEWDATQLSLALDPIGIDVQDEAATARYPAELERLYPGSMSWANLHPFMAGAVVPFAALVVFAIVLAGLGVIH